MYQTSNLVNKYSIEEFPGENIYLVLFSYAQGNNFNDRIELSKKSLHLKLSPTYVDITNSKVYNAQLQVVFDKNKTQLYNAYNNYMKSHPDYTNKVIFMITLSKNGKVIAVTDHHSSAKTDDFTEKLANLISTFDFTALDENTRDMLFYYPIDFTGK